jgi:hypothetical protein
MIEGNPMAQDENLKAKTALEILEQAYAYYTPEKRPEAQTPVYEEYPLAA